MEGKEGGWTMKEVLGGGSSRVERNEEVTKWRRKKGEDKQEKEEREREREREICRSPTYVPLLKSGLS